MQKKTLIANNCKQDYKALYSTMYTAFCISFVRIVKALWKFNYLLCEGTKVFFLYSQNLSTLYLHPNNLLDLENSA